MRDLRRPEQFEAIVKQLTESKEPDTQLPVFETIRDLLILAALLGFARKKRLSGLKLSGPVPWRVFENARKDGTVYWLGLMETRSAEILRPEQDAEERLAQIFEEYSAGGLSIIADLLRDNPADTTGFKTLLAFLVDELGRTEVTEASTELADVRF